MPNQISTLFLIILLSSCSISKGNDYIKAPNTPDLEKPIKIHYNGSKPPTVIFVKDTIPDPASISPEYIPYGNSYWWWH